MESGFSINEQILETNMDKQSGGAQRVGGILTVDITKNFFLM